MQVRLGQPPSSPEDSAGDLDPVLQGFDPFKCRQKRTSRIMPGPALLALAPRLQLFLDFFFDNKLELGQGRRRRTSWACRWEQVQHTEQARCYVSHAICHISVTWGCNHSKDVIGPCKRPRNPKEERHKREERDAHTPEDKKEEVLQLIDLLKRNYCNEKTYSSKAACPENKKRDSSIKETTQQSKAGGPHALCVIGY